MHNLKVDLLQNILIALLIISVPIISIPEKFRILGIGRLSYYFLVLMLLLFILDVFINGKKIENYFKRFILLCTGWIIITTIYGCYDYAYLHEIDFKQSRMFCLLLSKLNLNENNILLKQLFIMLKSMVQGITLYVMPWICSYIVYTYVSSNKSAFEYFRGTYFVLAALLLVYSVPEILFFKFDWEYGASILKTLNSYFYDPVVYLGWHPPLVWHNEQLRSFCIEPAVLGCVAASIIPFLWSYIINEKNNFYVVFYSLFVILPVMSKSRLAVALLIFLCSQLIWYIKSTNHFWKKMIVIGIATLSAICIAIYEPTNEISAKSNVGKYVQENVVTITDPNARSNSSRLINIKSHLNVLKQRPLMGTGTSLKDMYVRNNLTDDALRNGEIYAITQGIDRNGIFKYSYGDVNGVIVTAVNIGVVGLLIVFLPFVMLLYLFYKKKLYYNNGFLTVFISMMSSVVSMCAGSISLNFYILAGLAYAMLKNTKEQLYYEVLDY